MSPTLDLIVFKSKFFKLATCRHIIKQSVTHFIGCCRILKLLWNWTRRGFGRQEASCGPELYHLSVIPLSICALSYSSQQTRGMHNADEQHTSGLWSHQAKKARVTCGFNVRSLKMKIKLLVWTPERRGSVDSWTRTQKLPVDETFRVSSQSCIM